jgi:hypothetical protein
MIYHSYTDIDKAKTTMKPYLEDLKQFMKNYNEEEQHE